jgi:hypothetical protein
MHSTKMRMLNVEEESSNTLIGSAAHAILKN